MSVPILGTEQYQYTDTGVLLNADVALPFFDITSIEGLDGTPAVSSTMNSTGADGGIVDAANEDIRTVTVEGTIYAAPSNLETYLDTLKANFAPRSDDAPFYFRTDDSNVPRMVMGKSLGLIAPKDNRRSIGIIDAQFSIACGDSRIYSSTLLATGLIPVGSNGTITLVGNRSSFPVIRLNGPITAPFTITGGGTIITYSETVIAGSVVLIDTQAHTVLTASGDNKRDKVSFSTIGKWPLLLPGANVWSLAGPGGAGNINVTGRSAWR